MKLILLPAFFLFFCVSVSAQQFGGFRPSVKFRQINGEGVRVIYPKGFDSAGLRVTAVVSGLKNLTLPTIGTREQKINIVLQPSTTIANAYVTMGPFRSELYLTPAQNSFDLGSISWLDMLAVHEYRHVQQYNNFNVGLSRVFRILFGQQGQALANAAAVPNWFWEGDAVFQETLVSTQGRGRVPFFFNDYRALWSEGLDYSYMKLRNGSLRDFVPDHYKLGYIFVAYGRQKYGAAFWKDVTGDAAAYKGLFYPFQRAIKKHGNISFNQFRTEAINGFKNESETTPQVNRQRRPYMDEEFPAITEDGKSIIYVRSGYKNIPAFVKRSTENGKRTESIIRVRDVSLDNHFSLKNGKIVYASRRQHPRWGWTDYNELQVLDVATGKQQTLTHRSRYFSPDISGDNKIIAVNVQPGGKSFLHLLDGNTGALLKAFPNPDHYFYTYPRFAGSNRVISAVRTAAGDMTIVSIDLSDGSSVQLTPPGKRIIGFPSVVGDTIFFSATDKKTESVFALVQSQKKLFRVASATGGQGAYQPVFLPDKLIFSSFTAGGFKLQENQVNARGWAEMTEQEWNVEPTEAAVLTGDVASGKLYSIDSGKSYNEDTYPKLTRPFNFHSLRPLVDDPNYSFSILGENVLNTLQSELSFTYNRTEQYKQFGFNTVYGGLFPYIRAGVDYTMDRRARYRGNRIYFNELQMRGGLSVPLNLSKGRSFIRMNIGSDYVYTQPTFQGLYKDSIGDRDYSSLNNYISFSHQIQQARQHILPRFAQTVTLNFRKGISRYKGNQFLANGNLYFPGMFRTHNLTFNLAVQVRDSLNQNNFSNGFPFSRGYTAENLYRMYKLGANYHLPLVYPDWGFGNLVYLMRVRANLFYDYTKVQDFNTARQLVNVDFRSTGVEIFFDTKWWNELPVNFGIRYSRLLDADIFGDHGPNWFEFVLPVNLVR